MFWNRALRALFLIVAILIGIQGLRYFPISDLAEAVKEFTFFLRVSYGLLLVVLALGIARIPIKLWYTTDKMTQKDRTAWTLNACFTSVCWLVAAVILREAYPRGPFGSDILAALTGALATGLYLKQTDVGNWPMSELFDTVDWAGIGLTTWLMCTVGGAIMTYSAFNAIQWGLGAVIGFLFGLAIAVLIVWMEGEIVIQKLTSST